MKINIKKGAIALALVASIGVTTTGCGASMKDITYETNASGYVESIEGTVSYDFLDKCFFAKVTNEITNETYYTIAFEDDGITLSSERYDIFTKQRLSTSNYTNSLDTTYVFNLTPWLNAMNMTKSEYTEEELRAILKIFIEIQEKEEQLVIEETNPVK